MKTLATLASRLGAAVAGLRGRSTTSAARAFLTGADVSAGPARQLVSPYNQSAWVYAATNLIAGEISSRPLCFYAGDQKFDESKFSAWWQAPAVGPRRLGRQTRMPVGAVLRDLASWAKLEGEFFLVFDDSWLLAPLQRDPAALSPFLIARPDRVDLIVRAGVLEGYRITDAGGRQMLALPEQVEHWKAFNPHDDWRGVGAAAAARVATESAFFTGAYIRDLMRNNGDPGFIVIAKGGPLDPAQQEAVVADLRAKRRALERGVARDLFLGGDITVDRPPERTASGEVISSKGSTAQEIYTAFGVPASMAEAKQNYSMGKDSDRYQLITGTCVPLGAEISSVLATSASRMTGQALTAELEWDDHPVMVEVRYGRIETALKLWGAGMPLRSASEYLDLALPPFPGDDQGYLPFSVSPVLSAAPAAAPSEPVVDPSLNEDPQVAALRTLVLARTRAQMLANRAEPPAAEQVERDVLAGFTCNCGVDTIAQRADRPAAEIARWRDHMRQRRETVVSFKSAYGRVFMGARIETLRKIEAGTKSHASVQRAGGVVDLLFDVARIGAEFIGAMRNQQKQAIDKAGTQLFAELGRDDVFRYPPSDVVAYMARRQNKLRDIPQEVYDRLKASLQEGLEAGETTAQLAARAKKFFNTLNETDALRIAQTETGAAYGTGRHAAMQKAGIKFKAWLTSGNANVREAHQLAGLTYSPDTPIPIDEPYIVDGEELMHPGDDAGSAGNVINCHCVSLPVEAPEPGAN